ncbi:uncharacterized protein METZ01_LOCUS108148 [marine metagenome]|uniref:Uncharacterized protein n=1 Tax=marine metagenome TaxID=408172 RepID=A0A381WS19_9ZZZZ
MAEISPLESMVDMMVENNPTRNIP